MKKTILILFVLALAGCGSSLKNSWSNFTAYYNTFYNAKQDFAEGINLVEKQPVQLNPDTLIQAHPTPVLTGEEHFERAVDNAAQVLRRFSNSKWTDDALLLMGKSYYYLQEYFLALQKFEEILDLPSQTPLKQQAVIWKARTLLAIGSYSEGIQFLENQLDNFQGNWRADNKAEVQVLLAEHLAMLGNLKESARILEEAVPNLEKEALKGRSYFLWGQLLEKNNELIKAFQVYDNVERYFLDYEYIYWAEMKQAKVSRMGDRTELAITIYYNMLRDDKSFERRYEIYYQLAQTYEEQGKYREAENTYKYILANSTQSSARQLLANTYYQLGQLYSNRYSNYNLAAAYFDSSSSLSVQTMQGAGDIANKMATAYNRYIALKQDINRTESLLELSEMSEQELKAELAAIRQQHRETMQQSQNVVQQTRNTLSNTAGISQTAGQNTVPSAFGFLNYRNKELLQQGRQQFIAKWGQRPLVDNWRRREAILDKDISETSTDISSEESLQNQQQPIVNETLGINIDEVPRTEEAKEKVRNEQLNTLYRLGSLFFLTLNQPDSAETYYRRILEQSPPDELEAQTLYSLYELYKLEQQPDSITFYRDRILQSYPDSKYAAQILENDNGDHIQPAGEDSTQVLRRKVQEVLTKTGRDTPSVQKAEQLRQMAINDTSSPLASAIFYEAIRESIQYAHYRDSVIAAADTLDKGVASRDRLYTGSHWDEVRNLIIEFQERFPNAKQLERVNTWLNVLKQPEQILEIPTCETLEIEPTMIQEKTSFIQSISLPEKVRDMNISGILRYQLTITEQGRVEAAQLLSNPTGLGIEEAYREAILSRLRFEPVIHNGEAIRVNCEVEFPISRSR